MEVAGGAAMGARGRLEAEDTQAKNKQLSPQGIFLLVSALMMSLLLLLPIWDCAVLLHSPMFRHFAGVVPTIALLVACSVALVLYVVIIRAFFSVSRPQAHTSQTMSMIGKTMLTVLGLVFMLSGHTLATRAHWEAQELLTDCNFDQATAPLVREWEFLSALRALPGCAQQKSVETCGGYTGGWAARVLKSMEFSLRCSTFCRDYVAHISGGHAQPRTLFSKADFKASCQFQMARELEDYVQDVGIQLYYEGCMLVLTAVAMGFLSLIGFCSPRSRWSKALTASYGTMHFAS